MRHAVLVALLVFAACSDEAPGVDDAGPVGDLGTYIVETTYDDGCDAPVMLEIELREGGVAIVENDGALVSTTWGIIGDGSVLLFPDVNLRHAGLRWSANPVLLDRMPDAEVHGFGGDIGWHSEIGPWCRGTVSLTRLE